MEKGKAMHDENKNRPPTRREMVPDTLVFYEMVPDTFSSAKHLEK
jgi:hypothetical protein